MARRKGRDISGILLIDKPYGLTSNAALQKVKWLYKANKAGHTGSLDPMATGMLPICLGEATKFSSHLLDADKRYRAVCKLGFRTDTADAEGSVIETRAVPAISSDLLSSVISRFTGQITQIPPMYSALKRDGVPLYELARKGVVVAREPRAVTIYALSVLRFEGDELEIEVHCSKGTYIRTLGEDIGDALGCGAHLSYLRRTAVGGFPVDQMVTLETLIELADRGFDQLDALLLPSDQAICDWPTVRLDEDQGQRILLGQEVDSSCTLVETKVRLYMADGRFLGVGEVAADGKIAPRRLVNLA